MIAEVGAPPPLPRRKPIDAVELAGQAPAAGEDPQPKFSAASAPAREKQPEAKQEIAQGGGGLLGLFKPGSFNKPMTLAPADKAAPSRPAAARPGGGAYASQVWGKLARAKPRAEQRGSASVAFSIGGNGTLGAVRIARSSGNARIDQLAIQTVRNAAPFPPPPSGGASYTIRIDF